MDFKVAGTKNGITAIQMDVKIEGITLAILSEALEKGKAARMHILGDHHARNTQNHARHCLRTRHT